MHPASSQDAQDFINVAVNAWMGDLYTFTLRDGATVLRWTDADVEIPYDGLVYELGPKISRDRITKSMGLQVEPLILRIIPRLIDSVGGMALGDAFVHGVFDGGHFRLDRAFGTGPTDIRGAFASYFTGRVGPIKGDGMRYAMQIRPPTELLDAPFPANVYEPGCHNRLFDYLCALNADTWKRTGIVTANVSPAQFDASVSTSPPAGWLNLGRVRFTSGDNAGFTMPIKSWSGTVMTFPAPWPFPVGVGDTFETWAGCDKTLATCESKFNNRIHFRGQPFVPVPEVTT